MRCYRKPDGLFAGTQAEAGDGFSRIDVPDTKDGLINFLNALVTAPGAPIIEIRGGDLPHVLSDDDGIWRRIKRIPAAGLVDAGATTLTVVEEFIQNANHRQLASVMENAILRMRELGSEAGL